MALRIPINLASEPFRRDRPLLVGSAALAVVLSLLLIYQVIAIVSERHQAADIRIAIDRQNAQLQGHCGPASHAERHAAQAGKCRGAGAQSFSEHPD